MKKTFITLITIMMLVITMSGCGSDKTQTNNNQQTGNNTNQGTEQTDNNNISSETDGQINETNETKVLEDIQLSDERSGKAWKYDLGTDGSKIAMSAGYTVDTDYVYDITFSVEIKKGNNTYEEFKSDLMSYESQLKALNDDEIRVNFRETDEGIEFVALFDGLEYANREKRITMAEEIIGIHANDSDVTFRFSEMDSELKNIGFVYGA